MEKIVRTLRCKNANIPGTLGKLATAIGKAGLDIGNIATVHLGPHYTIRDIDVYAENEEQLAQAINEVSRLKEVSVLQVRDAVLEFHKNGKIKMISTVPITSLDTLRKVYTPGVFCRYCYRRDCDPWIGGHRSGGRDAGYGGKGCSAPTTGRS